MARIFTLRTLLIGLDPVIVHRVAALLLAEGHGIKTATTGASALETSAHFHPDIAVVECELDDGSGLAISRELHRIKPNTAVILIAGDRSFDVAVAAMRSGAFDVCAKPIVVGDLMDSIHRASEHHGRAHSSPWRDDAAHSSPGGLRNWCHTARQVPRRSLLFARMLRAVYRQGLPPKPPADLLNIVDRRTLAKLLSMCGGSGANLPATVDEFLDRQRLIEDPHAVDQVRRLLSSRLPAGASGHER
jgi:ActR/RegA family two-component response regulator